MSEIRNLVVGVDFSACSKSALVQAVRLARHYGAALHVLHVIEPLVAEELADAMAGSATEAKEAVRLDAERHVHQWLAEVGADDAAAVGAVIGIPIDELVDKIGQVNAELLVLGVYGVMGELGGTGTLSTRCVRTAACNVMLVGEFQSGPYHKVVACVDFSETAARAAAEALEVASMEQAELHLLHAYLPPWRRLLGYQKAPAGVSQDYRLRYVRALTSRLQMFADELRAAAPKGTPEVRCELVEAVSYGRGIVGYAQQIAADLVVLGTLGHTNLRYAIMGSTAERVLRELRCSVMTVTPMSVDAP